VTLGIILPDFLVDILAVAPALTMSLDRSTPLPWVARAGGQPWLTKILARALLIVIVSMCLFTKAVSITRSAGTGGLKLEFSESS
jgi:hypothetical protein